MSANAETILNEILKVKWAEVALETNETDYFEIFTADQATKEFELSYEELENGVVDGEHDGGIDSVYTFINGEIVDEEVSFTVPKKSAEIDLVIIQSKANAGPSEAAINKIISTAGHLLDLSADHTKLTQYNEDVRARTEIFRKTYRKVASKFPKVTITYIYASKKSLDHIHPNTQKKADELILKTKDLFDEASVRFLFWGARELLALARKKPNQVFELKFDQSLNGSGGYVALVKLTDFYNFLCGGESKVRSDLFEANVRDYQGTTEVNQQISKTLEGDQKDDFWWFNNGVTVLGSRATSSGSIITIENPQIVNGLQTSSEVGSYCKNSPVDIRTVMVKVVASEDEEVRDRIIKATNSQNPVPLASLRATDKVQRDIEHHLKANDLFYDRRKNFYKNEGKPASKIISINLLSQALMTLFLGQPDNARARPSSLIKDDDVYKSLFSEDFDLDSYLVAADAIRRVELHLKDSDNLTARDRNNLRFYVLYWLVASKVSSLSLTPKRVASLKGTISESEVKKAICVVRKLFDAEGASDQVAKGPAFKDTVKDSVRDLVASRRLP